MSDYSIFPKALDGYAQLPLFVDNITPVNAEGLNRIRSAIVNIETTLGILPQGDSNTVSIRLDSIEANIDSIEANIDSIEANITIIESSLSALESRVTIIEDSIYDLPNALFLNEASTPTAQTNKGAIFVSDGSGGLVQNNLYYSNESGVITDLLSGGEDLATTLGIGNETVGNNIILSSGDEIQGQTDVKLRSATNSNIDLISDGSGSVRIYTDNPADGLIFLQMGESQQTGMAHIPAGSFGPNGVLLLGFPDLVFPQLLPPGSTTVDVRVQSPAVSTNAVGAGVGSGNVDIVTGSTGFTSPGTEGGSSGQLKLGTGGVVGGSATPSSGEIIVRTGQSTMGNSGDVTIASGSVLGTGSTGTSGSTTITTGDAQATGCSSGNIILEPGVLTSPSTGTRGFVQVKGEKLNFENGPNSADIMVGSASNAIMVGGANNSASGESSFIGGGVNNDTSADGASILGGRWALANHDSEHAHSSGRFSTAGDAQYSRIVLRRETSNASPLELTTTGLNAVSGTDLLSIANNTAYRFRVDAVAREDATGDTSWWEIKGCIKRGTGAASVALVGSQYVITDFDAGASSWQLLVAADTTAGSLKIEATGEAAHTIRWVATVHLTRVNG